MATNTKAALDRIVAAKDNPGQLQAAINEARAAGVDAATLAKIEQAKSNPAQLQQAIQAAQDAQNE